MQQESRFRLNLLGPFGLFGPDGARIEISSKKGCALVAMLAMSRDGIRSRTWLQAMLWGSRAPEQAGASLRRELSELRRILNGHSEQLLVCEHGRAELRLDHLRVDAHDRHARGRGSATFLEGLDVPGEDNFEEWLRLERAAGNDGVAQPASEALARREKVEAAFSGRPALAVLPFVDNARDGGSPYLAEGISEDLIDRLSRLRWLPVIARGSSFQYGGGSVDPKAVGEALGARYLLEGRIRRDGERLRVTASLCDTVTVLTVWTNQVVLSGIVTSAMVELLVTGLVGAIDARIDAEEQRRALHRPASDTDVDDLLWRGRWHFNQFTRADAAAAKYCFERALALQPHSPEALVQHAWSTLRSIWAERKSQEQIRAVRQLAAKAIVADADDGRGYLIAGMAEMWLRQSQRAETLLAQAIKLNPSLVAAHTQIGTNAYLSGRPTDAIAPIEKAMLLSPADYETFFMLGELSMAHMMLERWDEAIELADRSLALRPRYWIAHVVKINALVRSGRSTSARAALVDLDASDRPFEEGQINWIPFTESKWHVYLKDGLHRAREATR